MQFFDMTSLLYIHRRRSPRFDLAYDNSATDFSSSIGGSLQKHFLHCWVVKHELRGLLQRFGYTILALKRRAFDIRLPPADFIPTGVTQEVVDSQRSRLSHAP